MSAAIMTNNIQVAILAFAGGVTFGLLTVYLLIYNGIIIGALAALFWQHGKAYEFWAYIVPHGMIELTAIFIAGGAGLLMGYKLFVPGHFSRGYQLKQQAKRSVQLFLGTIPLFVIAGIIEGFITPASISLEAKYIVAFLTVIGLIFICVIGKLLLKRRKATKASIHNLDIMRNRCDASFSSRASIIRRPCFSHLIFSRFFIRNCCWAILFTIAVLYIIGFSFIFFMKHLILNSNH